MSRRKTKKHTLSLCLMCRCSFYSRSFFSTVQNWFLCCGYLFDENACIGWRTNIDNDKNKWNLIKGDRQQANAPIAPEIITFEREKVVIIIFKRKKCEIREHDMLLLNYASKLMSSNAVWWCSCVQTCWINIYFSTNKTNGATQPNTQCRVHTE